uniref:Uncharacterized protein n=1 Tax=Arundo donax TaxID=35708 RepID=A0A0A8YNT5_ARUDO
MFRAKKPMVAEGEVRVQKVEKIERVYNLVTRPTQQVTVMVKPAADVALSGRKKVPRGPVNGMVSAKDIDDYIARKKQQFVQPEA